MGFEVYCMDELSDHKVGIYCTLIGPLDQSLELHFLAKRFQDIFVRFEVRRTAERSNN